MKVKMIARSQEEFTRDRSNDIQKVFRNPDPNLHSQSRAQEYVRALNAAKLDKVFAKPFVGAMSGHIDAVCSMAKDPSRLKSIFSGSMDGDIRLWDLAARSTIAQFSGHRGAVRGLTVSKDGERLVSCGEDCVVRLWDIQNGNLHGSLTDSQANQKPIATYVGTNAFRAVDHKWESNIFATAGVQVDIWDHNRSEPINSFTWGSDTVISVRFNPSEKEVFASTASDRSIVLYDLRMGSPLHKIIMQTRNNAVAWNPREPMNFTAANEDGNCYSYDMRRMNTSTCVHQDHVSAVIDIDYSPTGREFVTGSYDRTVRIFPYNAGHSREIYHTKRMQRVFCARFSCDATYVISGSDDTNLRLWKAKASEQLGVLLPRERRKHEYLESVKERFKHLPEIKSIDRHRHLPKPIYKAVQLRNTMHLSQKRKEERKRKHSAPGSVVNVPLRRRKILDEQE